VDDPKFDNLNQWTFIRLPPNFRLERVMAIINLNEGKKFNWLGYVCHPCICCRFGAKFDEAEPLERDAFFCSELITIVIQEQSKLLDGINPRDTSPKMLYDRLLEGGCPVVCTNPLRI
jgi:hypothetical protein